MPEAADNIPTLTDIIQKGDASMLNHFDAHQFNTPIDSTLETIQEHDSEDKLQDMMEVSNIIENASNFENTDTDFEIPSIKLEDEEKTEIPEQVFSDEVALHNKTAIKHTSKNNISEDDILKEKINKAVELILPTIENKLKEQLYKQFNI